LKSSADRSSDEPIITIDEASTARHVGEVF
jgi:hypothetical protein